MNYPGIRIEGAILSPDLLDRLEELPGQRPGDFGLQPAVRVKDEIARAWADAQDYWRIFRRRLETLKTDSPATTETRQQWMVPLLGLLGYRLEYQPRAVELYGKAFPISHRTSDGSRIPVQIVGYGEPAGLDRKPERAALRISAHAVVQEFLNLSEQLYGLVTNGRLLRLLRDSSRLVKLSYLEFDLDRIFGEALFADFALLFRLLHASRLPAGIETAPQAWIERYHQDSLDSGARIREGLSRAVERALGDFGNGLLAHPANGTLRQEIAAGRLTADDYYRLLLRLIYRLLFLMVIEERDLLFPPHASVRHREIYRRGYSLERLRRLSERRYLADAHYADLWPALLACFRLFEADGPGERLGLAPLAGDLFGREGIGLLADCTLGNDVLLGCLQSLNLYEHPESRQLIRVNYAALNVEEFGSVYEGLLEYRPVFRSEESIVGEPASHQQMGQIGPMGEMGRPGQSGRFSFDFVAGEARSATGSHYTPDDLVQPLIRHALDPLIARQLEEAKTSGQAPAEALLDLCIADIACGSGHILLAAARRIATELAALRTGEEQPSPTAYRAALREVICNCIYGVDLNPLAVELCKVALWLEAHNPGLPLNFLDHHIKCGNAIVGFVRREEVDRGIPDEAFAAMPGDEKEPAAAWRKNNRQDRVERSFGQKRLQPGLERQLERRLDEWKALSRLPEHTPAEIAAKKRRFQAFAAGPEACLLEQIADIPLAQFYIPKTAENRGRLITDYEFRGYWDEGRTPQGPATAMAWSVARHKRFFHWFLEFPEIVARGGFDAILGNPPYLGGQHLSGTYGYPFCHYVKWEYAPTGLSELVVFFLRRIFGLLRPQGFTGLITTNSIKDGDIRKDGLEQVLAQGGEINMAVRGIKWPGRANLVVSLVAVHKGPWKGKRSLDGAEVPVINAFFESSDVVGEPEVLLENKNRLYQGSIFLGDGFLLTHEEAERLLQLDVRNREVIFPVINGQEVNNRPDQKPGRSIINFHDWSREKAETYAAPFEIVEKLVKPERMKSNRSIRKEKWWQHAEKAIGLYDGISNNELCFVAAATTKYLNFSAVQTDFVYLNTLYVLTTDRWDLYAVVQSTLHEVWARKYSGALETRLRYSPSDCFETFPFPEGLWREANPALADIGERYHEHRRRLMLSLWLGLTDIYNLFHDRDLTAEKVARVSKKPAEEARQGYEGLLELRRLHGELDRAVGDAYGWTDLDLSQDFREIETLAENDRLRYTIGPAARRELLNRLLVLNHTRAQSQSAATPVAKRKPKRPNTQLPTLFSLPEEP